MQTLWQWGVLVAGIGFFILSLVACFVLLNLTQSLRTTEEILALTLEEARRALPEVRHSLEQMDEMVTSINEKFSAADRAMNVTGATINGWRERFRERFETFSSWARHAARAGREGRSS